MTCSLPPEILDHIVDHLHDESATLGACCIVSKSWIPRSRIHLFAHVNFTNRLPVGSWAEAFTDPLNSPAHYTRTLEIQGRDATTTVGADANRWIRTFHNVAHLHISYHPEHLVLFHGLSPTIRSLHLQFGHVQLSECFDLMCSFPLLEDLTLLVYDCEDDVDGWTTPSTSPRLNGTLELRSMVRIGPITRWLLNLPNGLNFTEVFLTCANETDFKSTTDLVSGCSNTLEFLGFVNLIPDPPATTSVDLSAATKLKRLEFLCAQPGVRWVTETLQTVESKNLQEITLQSDHSAQTYGFEGLVCHQWHDLDRLLVRFWTSHSIRPKVAYEVGTGRDMRDYAPSMLPELTRRGLVDLVKYDH